MVKFLEWNEDNIWYCYINIRNGSERASTIKTKMQSLPNYKLVADLQCFGLTAAVGNEFSSLIYEFNRDRHQQDQHRVRVFEIYSQVPTAKQTLLQNMEFDAVRLGSDGKLWKEVEFVVTSPASTDDVAEQKVIGYLQSLESYSAHRLLKPLQEMISKEISPEFASIIRLKPREEGQTVIDLRKRVEEIEDTNYEQFWNSQFMHGCITEEHLDIKRLRREKDKLVRHLGRDTVTFRTEKISKCFFDDNLAYATLDSKLLAVMDKKLDGLIDTVDEYNHIELALFYFYEERRSFDYKIRARPFLKHTNFDFKAADEKFEANHRLY